jgi:hypothetical protein
MEEIIASIHRSIPLIEFCPLLEKLQTNLAYLVRLLSRTQKLICVKY